MEDLSIIIDGRPLTTYPLGKPGFHAGTETFVIQLAKGLAERGHTVHTLTPDLDHEEQRGTTEWWWGPENHPRYADVVIGVFALSHLGDLVAPLLVMAPNGIDPPLYDYKDQVDAYACFTQAHADLMVKRMRIDPWACHITGLGVIPPSYRRDTIHREYGRMLWANDPTRGLWHCLDIYDAVRKQVPEASLVVSYGFDQQFQAQEWRATALAEVMWECKRRLATTPGVESMGQLTELQMVKQQMQTHVHAMPSDPQNVGSQLHGLTQLELAAAGVPLVLSDIEAFPEIFGEVAEILPLPGMMRKATEKDMVRVDAQDWADVVVSIMKDTKKWRAMSKAGRELAEKHTWAAVIDRWETLLQTLLAQLRAKAAA